MSKGDWRRPQARQGKFDENFDKIDWSDGEKRDSNWQHKVNCDEPHSAHEVPGCCAADCWCRFGSSVSSIPDWPQ